MFKIGARLEKKDIVCQITYEVIDYDEENHKYKLIEHSQLGYEEMTLDKVFVEETLIEW